MKYLKYLLWTLLASVLILQGYFFIQILLWRWVNPETTAFQRAELQRLCSTSKICALKKDWIPLKEISPTLRRAVMISEDSDFYRHHGFELKAMKEAWQRNQQKGKHLRGGSTITQQLAKKSFSVRRKKTISVKAKNSSLPACWNCSSAKIVFLRFTLTMWSGVRVSLVLPQPVAITMPSHRSN